MKVISKQVERKTVQKDCVVVVETTSGIEVTMYGEIINGQVEAESTAPSFWNSKVFNALSEADQQEVVKATNEALRDLL